MSLYYYCNPETTLKRKGLMAINSLHLNLFTILINTNLLINTHLDVG